MTLIRKSRLASGIKVITEEVPDVESSTVGIWVNTGSRNEPSGLGGVSHLIEHLLFKGTERRTALEISKTIESVGGVLNAFTGREYTCFYAKVLNKDLPLAIDLLSDIVLNSKFAPKEIEREKMVVLQEIKMVEDTPDDLIHDLYTERFWKGHPLGHPILGTTKSVTKMRREDILDYFRSHYRPDNIFITAAGSLKHDDVEKLLAGTFGQVRKSRAKTELTTPRPVKGSMLVKKDLSQVHLCLGVPVTAQTHAERFRVYLISTILGGGMSSRLFQEVREKRALAYSVYSYLNLCMDAGTLVVYAGISKDSFSEVVGLVLKEFAKLRRGVSDEELSHAKEQLKGGMLLGLETTDSRMMKLARDEIYFKKVIPVKSIIRAIDRVSPSELKETASSVLTARKATLVAIGNVSKKGLPKVFC